MNLLVEGAIDEDEDGHKYEEDAYVLEDGTSDADEAIGTCRRQLNVIRCLLFAPRERLA